MRIAVTSQNYKTITPHAGRTRRFLVFEAEPGIDPIEVDRLDLPKEMSMLNFHDSDDKHPLDEMDVLIVGSCGPAFAERMSERGVKVISTKMSDPVDAIYAYVVHPDEATDRAYAHPARRAGGEASHSHSA